MGVRAELLALADNPALGAVGVTRGTAAVGERGQSALGTGTARGFVIGVAEGLVRVSHAGQAVGRVVAVVRRNAARILAPGEIARGVVEVIGRPGVRTPERGQLIAPDETYSPTFLERSSGSISLACISSENSSISFTANLASVARKANNSKMYVVVVGPAISSNPSVNQYW